MPLPGGINMKRRIGKGARIYTHHFLLGFRSKADRRMESGNQKGGISSCVTEIPNPYATMYASSKTAKSRRYGREACRVAASSVSSIFAAAIFTESCLV